MPLQVGDNWRTILPTGATRTGRYVTTHSCRKPMIGPDHFSPKKPVTDRLSVSCMCSCDPKRRPDKALERWCPCGNMGPEPV
jgi:hypothetical protein